MSIISFIRNLFTNKPTRYNIRGCQWWYLNNELRRTDGRAVIWEDGSQHWYLNGQHHGQYHRADGPAVILKNGTQVWYRYGERHREDGPAVIHPDGRQFWYYHGVFIKYSPVIKKEWYNINASITIKDGL